MESFSLHHINCENIVFSLVCNGVILSSLSLGDWQSSYRRCRKDEVVLCRACIGHTHLTHSYILRKDPPPQCEHCQCILAVRHILVKCNRFAQIRKDIFGRKDMIQLFRLLHLRRVIILLYRTVACREKLGEHKVMSQHVITKTFYLCMYRHVAICTLGYGYVILMFALQNSRQSHFMTHTHTQWKEGRKCFI